MTNGEEARLRAELKFCKDTVWAAVANAERMLGAANADLSRTTPEGRRRLPDIDGALGHIGLLMETLREFQKGVERFCAK